MLEVIDVKMFQPSTIEAKILAVSDSASHMTDINYICMFQSYGKDFTLDKLERDYRDISLFPELKLELTKLYFCWKNLIETLSETVK